MQLSDPRQSLIDLFNDDSESEGKRDDNGSEQPSGTAEEDEIENSIEEEPSTENRKFIKSDAEGVSDPD